MGHYHLVTPTLNRTEPKQIRSRYLGGTMKHKADFIMQNVVGENLLVPLGPQVMELNGLITLNDTAACVWELLAKECTLDELASAVAERFDVSFEIARVDVQTFMNEITRLGLLEP